MAFKSQNASAQKAELLTQELNKSCIKNDRINSESLLNTLDKAKKSCGRKQGFFFCETKSCGS